MVEEEYEVYHKAIERPEPVMALVPHYKRAGDGSLWSLTGSKVIGKDRSMLISNDPVFNRISVGTRHQKIFEITSLEDMDNLIDALTEYRNINWPYPARGT